MYIAYMEHMIYNVYIYVYKIVLALMSPRTISCTFKKSDKCVMLCDAVKPTWPANNLFCDTFGSPTTSSGTHFATSSSQRALLWHLLELPWAPCNDQFDPPGPMLENYRKTTKKITFLE